MAQRLEALEKVREAERQVRDLKARSEEEKDRRLRKAKGESLNLEADLRQQAERRYQEVLEAAAAAMQAELKEILERGNEEAQRIRAVASGKVDRAIELLLKRFEEAVHAET